MTTGLPVLASLALGGLLVLPVVAPGAGASGPHVHQLSPDPEDGQWDEPTNPAQANNAHV